MPLLSRIAQKKSQLKAKLHLTLRQRGETVALLDYDRRPIRLGVTSAIEYHTRLHSCKKEPETVAWIEQTFSPGDVFYDIGANVGAYTLVSAVYWGERVRVVAFEPSAVNYARLVRNLILNRFDRQVISLPVALTKATGLDTFHYENLTSGGALHILGDGASSKDKGFSPKASCSVMAFDLDTLINLLGLPRPTHIKLDVDGTELQVLEGAGQTLQGVQSLLVECDDAQPDPARIRTLLKGCGLREEAVYPFRYAESNPQFRTISNVLFCRPGTRKPVLPG